MHGLFLGRAHCMIGSFLGGGEEGPRSLGCMQLFMSG